MRDNPYPEFWWIRDKRYRSITVARVDSGRWTTLGGLSGWSDKEDIELDYDILGRVKEYIDHA